jgi:thioredoxin 1
MQPRHRCKLILTTAALVLAVLLLPALAQETKPPAALPEIMEFGRKLCPVCLQTELAIRSVQDRYPGQFVVRFLHVDEEPNLFRQYRVVFVPAQIFLDASGKQVFRHDGAYKPDQLEKRLRLLKFIE